jgi:protoporphyrinogen oxidase
VADVDVIVVGAGITGLSAARSLVRAGRSVAVLEAAGRPGGRMVRLSRNGDSADGGPQMIHSNYRELLGIIDELELTPHLRLFPYKLQLLDRDGTARLSAGDQDTLRILGMRGAADFLAFYLRYIRFGRKVDPFEVTQDIPEYDNISALRATRWAGKAFLDFVMRPLMYALTNSRPEYINLYHTLVTFRMMLTTTESSLQLGILSIAERLSERLPVHYGTPVQSLIYEQGRVIGVRLSDGRAMTAPHVIVACEVGGAAPLVPEELAPAKRFLEAFTHTPMPLVFFFLDRPTPSEAVSFMGHAYRDVPYNMALDHSKKAPGMVPSGKGIISAWPGHPQSSEIIRKSDADIIRMALADMEAFLPGIANWVEEARVVRQTWGLGRQEPGFHRKVLDFKEYTNSLRGVSFAGNDYDGVYMESGVRSGQRAAQRALAE